MYRGRLIISLSAALLVSMSSLTGTETTAESVTKEAKMTAEQTSPAADKSAALEVILSRKSVRLYTGKSIPQSEMISLVRAGMAAPSARNAQPWAFVVVTRREQLSALAEALPSGRMLAKAGGAIAVCGVEKEFLDGPPREMWVQDCSAATENILLAAEASGLGAVWLGVYPDKERISNVSRVLKLDAGVIPLNVISIGYPTGAERCKDKYKPEKIHFDTWNNHQAR